MNGHRTATLSTIAMILIGSPMWFLSHMYHAGKKVKHSAFTMPLRIYACAHNLSSHSMRSKILHSMWLKSFLWILFSTNMHAHETLRSSLYLLQLNAWNKSYLNLLYSSILLNFWLDLLFLFQHILFSVSIIEHSLIWIKNEAHHFNFFEVNLWMQHFEMK